MMTGTIAKEPRRGQVIHRTWTSTVRFRDAGRGSAQVPAEHRSRPPVEGAVVRESGKSVCVGEVIRARRRDLGITQEELAIRVRSYGIEIRQSDISRLEQGRVNLPRFARLQCIAEALSMPVGEFLARAGWDGADEALRDDADEPAMYRA